MRDFKVKQVYSKSLIWNQKYDFRAKLHDMKSNYHFISFILKLQNSVTQIHVFSVSSNILFIQ